MKNVAVGIAGIVGGLLLSVLIEVKTGQCMLYHYDKVVHPDYF